MFHRNMIWYVQKCESIVSCVTKTYDKSSVQFLFVGNRMRWNEMCHLTILCLLAFWALILFIYGLIRISSEFTEPCVLLWSSLHCLTCETLANTELSPHVAPTPSPQLITPTNVCWSPCLLVGERSPTVALTWLRETLKKSFYYGHSSIKGGGWVWSMLRQ